jgi:hypothetical protein
LVRLNSEETSEAAHPLFDGSALVSRTDKSAPQLSDESVQSNPNK